VNLGGVLDDPRNSWGLNALMARALPQKLSEKIVKKRRKSKIIRNKKKKNNK
jgi:hypothetical protein